MHASLTFPLHGGRRSDCLPDDSSIIYRLMVYANEAYRLPRDSNGVRVVSGLAYVTHAGRDLIAQAGELLCWEPRKDVAVISALGHTPLVVEIVRS